MNVRFVLFISLCVVNITIVPAGCSSPTPADKMVVAATLQALACAPSSSDGSKRTTITCFVQSITPSEWSSIQHILPLHVITRAKKTSPTSTPPSSAPQSPGLSPVISPGSFKVYSIQHLGKPIKPLTPFVPPLNL